ncbi:hypothetical protein SPRG_10163 [Saprolegnia parasitica CBS 223.65]|uniref:Uncharacterized protein n=1 Tax=Saprolegnia parasitica (strain CBS 223.65) TaxID=695850 RepID=A0A067CDL6_SAPPC|nr:hypothetical protein SPRG_10163 [Saprolegnia parasitica CBS 223.65]KDO24631.1 hypothetical protein SPRG_10163 [Saprolegnia parasitica CBS 223.65]|eukprot:XP_012204699.1 hypothetical protein SPRG_10163 [Saprolegnia parasitica CBS 223.65]
MDFVAHPAPLRPATRRALCSVTATTPVTDTEGGDSPFVSIDAPSLKTFAAKRALDVASFGYNTPASLSMGCHPPRQGAQKRPRPLRTAEPLVWPEEDKDNEPSRESIRAALTHHRLAFVAAYGCE